MTEFILIFIFSIWLLVNIIYIFYREALGKLGKWLHRWGWINEWSMYTYQNTKKEHYRILVADFNSVEEPLEWKSIELNQKFKPGLISPSNFKLNSFIKRCLKKITVQYRLYRKSTYHAPMFDYLCSVISQMPAQNKSQSKYRKIVIERKSLAENKAVVIAAKTIKYS